MRAFCAPLASLFLPRAHWFIWLIALGTWLTIHPLLVTDPWNHINRARRQLLVDKLKPSSQGNFQMHLFLNAKQSKYKYSVMLFCKFFIPDVHVTLTSCTLKSLKSSSRMRVKHANRFLNWNYTIRPNMFRFIYLFYNLLLNVTNLRCRIMCNLSQIGLFTVFWTWNNPLFFCVDEQAN